MGNIQSTNWQTVRWKPPPPRLSVDDPYIGWRTEFRPMEAQLTDFENAAFTVFIVLITRVILAFDLLLYLPLSKVDENMARAHKRNAYVDEKFYFRKYVSPVACSEKNPLTPVNNPINPCHERDGATSSNENNMRVEDDFEEMTLDEIFNGKECYFPGLIPLIEAYMEYIDCDNETLDKIHKYLAFVSSRASGELMSNAAYIRQFVQNHPKYNKDSVVTSEIAHDLMMHCKGIGEGEIRCPEIYGDAEIPRIRREDAYGTPLRGRLNSDERSLLIHRLIEHAEKRRARKIPRGARMHSKTFEPEVMDGI